MHYRRFGKMGWDVSEIGLGTWQFGGDWGAVTEEIATTILQTAVESGVNFFDTADVYGNGRSETIIGKFLQGCSTARECFVATKLGRLEGFPSGYSLDLFRRCAENSLKRLKREAIDLLQLHCVPQEHLERGEVFEWLRILQREGKIRAFGASVETIEQAKICLRQPDLASLQIIFNIFRQNAIEDLFAKATKNGTALIIRLPLASGLLSGKFGIDSTFAPTDHRFYNRDGQAFNVGETFSGLPFAAGVALVEEVRKVLPDGMPLAVAALRWILDHPEVGVVIPGATKVAQVTSNAAASDATPLGDALHGWLQVWYRDVVAKQIRGAV